MSLTSKSKKFGDTLGYRLAEFGGKTCPQKKNTVFYALFLFIFMEYGVLCLKKGGVAACFNE